MILRGVSKKSECAVTAKYQEMVIRIGGIEFPAPIAFAETDDVEPLLGREGVFTRFDVNFKQRSLTGEFIP